MADVRARTDERCDDERIAVPQAAPHLNAARQEAQAEEESEDSAGDAIRGLLAPTSPIKTRARLRRSNERTQDLLTPVAQEHGESR